jgi:hypothetical protein
MVLLVVAGVQVKKGKGKGRFVEHFQHCSLMLIVPFPLK